ncbi:hypothetical protein KCTC52924_00312 [Arenibacter antarcticus]|uniref:Peptidyl-prolyl cis-trans isomerase n=1 Tax=Arenibacter antarcticus TaxID=2040469 RepID=A0ABW5VAZ6_9FLAO|nr:FKBP-type peptidyl-prolyl cis-trans isomerase [Arenibacter sp. H213]MCM4169536.1 hypothetical protein [Arenibacter sp. H213]
MILKRVLLFAFVFVTIWSCKKDDGPSVVVVPPKNLEEVIPLDDTSIKDFLETHFYNYEEFESPAEGFNFKIKIDTLAGDNADKTSLMSQVTAKTISVPANRFGSEGEGMVDHTYYYLVAREGVGKAITVADSAFVRYEGMLLNGKRFDASGNSPVWFDLAGIQGGGARGFAEGTSHLKTGGAPIINADGTFSVEEYGVGLVIFPSGLGYYNSSVPNIPAYSPLVFTIDLFAMSQIDHDNDGIPSFMEDLNGNGYLYDDNTDIEKEIKDKVQFTANFMDPDDDGDGKPTREEILIDADGNISFPDTNGNGTPDYLDPTTK